MTVSAIKNDLTTGGLAMGVMIAQQPVTSNQYPVTRPEGPAPQPGPALQQPTGPALQQPEGPALQLLVNRDRRDYHSDYENNCGDRGGPRPLRRGAAGRGRGARIQGRRREEAALPLVQAG